MKSMVLKILFFLFGFSLFSQQKIPNGWDKIILNGKPAYMNLYTGDVSVALPKLPAKKPVVAKELDPTISHIVKKGETLSMIARMYAISVDDIYRLNISLDPKKLSKGQEVVVGYDKTKEGVVVYEEDEDLYTRKNRKLSATISSNLNKSVVNYATIKNNKPVESSNKDSLNSFEDNSVYHIVEKGDTLYRISKLYEVKVNDLKEWNGLVSNFIKIGQKLRIKD